MKESIVNVAAAAGRNHAAETNALRKMIEDALAELREKNGGNSLEIIETALYAGVGLGAVVASAKSEKVMEKTINEVVQIVTEAAVNGAKGLVERDPETVAFFRDVIGEQIDEKIKDIQENPEKYVETEDDSDGEAFGSYGSYGIYHG